MPDRTKTGPSAPALNHAYTVHSRKREDIPKKMVRSIWLQILEDFITSDEECIELAFEEGARCKVAIYSIKDQIKNRHLPMDATRRGDSVWLFKPDDKEKK